MSQSANRKIAVCYRIDEGMATPEVFELENALKSLRRPGRPVHVVTRREDNHDSDPRDRAISYYFVLQNIPDCLVELYYGHTCTPDGVFHKAADRVYLTIESALSVHAVQADIAAVLETFGYRAITE